MDTNHGRVEVGEFTYQPETGELERNGHTVRLRPKAARALDLLIEREGQLVTRDELKRWIWPDGRIEADLGLNVCIREIRAAFADDADVESHVETLRGRGYRLVAPVGKGRAGGAYSRHLYRWVGVAAIGLILVAAAVGLADRGGSGVRLGVLPLQVQPGTPDRDPLRQGLADELVSRLANADPDRIAVVGRTSTFELARRALAPREIGEQVRADYVLEGGVRPVGSRTRVTVHLLHVPSDTYAWSGSVDIAEGSIDEAARRISAGVLEALGSGGRPPLAMMLDELAPQSRAAVLRARYLRSRFTRDDSRRALDLLTTEAAGDADHAAVLAEMAAHHLILGDLPQAEALIARASAARAADAGIAHIAGRIALYGRQDPAAAVVELERAVRLEPGTAMIRHDYAQALAAVGRMDEAVSQGRVALDLDPVSSVVLGDIGWIFYFGGDPDAARATCGRTLALRPESLEAQKCVVLAAARSDEIHQVVDVVDDLIGGLGAASEDRAELATTLASGDARPLWTWLDEHSTSVGMGPLDRARVHALLGRDDQALDALATLPRPSLTLLLGVRDPAFDGLRGSREFAALLSGS